MCTCSTDISYHRKEIKNEYKSKRKRTLNFFLFYFIFLPSFDSKYFYEAGVWMALCHTRGYYINRLYNRVFFSLLWDGLLYYKSLKTVVYIRKHHTIRKFNGLGNFLLKLPNGFIYYSSAFVMSKETNRAKYRTPYVKDQCTLVSKNVLAFLFNETICFMHGWTTLYTTCFWLNEEKIIFYFYLFDPLLTYSN